MRRAVAHILAGAGLASAFLLPIAAIGRLDPSLLMWTPRHTAEFALVWAVYAAAATVALAWLTGSRHPRVEAVILAGLVAPSAMSLVTVGIREELLAFDMATAVRVAVGIVTVAVLGVILERWWHRPRAVVAFVRDVLPFGALLLIPIVTTLHGLHTRAAEHNIERRSLPEGRVDPVPGCRSVFVLVFDELAYDAVFTDDGVSLPSVSARLASARVYHRAAASATETDTSIAAYVSARAPRGWFPENGALGPFGVAQALGLRTEVVGWYFPYCDVLGPRVEGCRTYSMYNAATVFDQFNPLAPIVTVLNIWPYQLPAGLFKRPAAVWLHRLELDAIVARASSVTEVPVLRWVHLNVPHWPWLNDAGPLSLRAFEQTRPRYVRQLTEVDRAFRQIVHVLDTQAGGADATVILTADHGSRMGHAGNPLHVPLIVWTPNGPREDIDADVRVADVLRAAVQQACASPRPHAPHP